VPSRGEEVTVSVLSHFLKWNVGLAKAETQTTPAERDCLARHAAGRRVLAEIGVWHGVTTARLRAAMAPDGVLYAVDPYPVGRLGFSMQRRIAHAEVRRVGNGRVEWLRTTGADAARTLAATVGATVEFVFIDGDHSYDGLRADWEGWSGLIAPGGVVGLHDSRPTPDRPIQAAGSVRYTSEVVRADPRFVLLDEVDSLTVVRRVPS
jgi:predicted O-methyltransferase YrrM